MRGILLLVAVLPFCASGQDQAIQRSLIERGQQSDAFRLQLRQWQERLAVPPGEVQRQQALEARQRNERARFDEVSERQLTEVKPETPAQLRPYERQKAEEERRPLMAP
jgi:hypothetical protein